MQFLYRYLIMICCALTLPLTVQAAGNLRIASLKPSITDTIVALGLADRLVGVTRYCELPDNTHKPEIVADYTRPFSERLMALAPDLVMGSEENSSRRSIEALQQAGLTVKLYPFGNLAETEQSIRAIGRDLGEGARGETAARQLEQQIEHLRKQYRTATPLRVVVIWGTRPLVAAGPGTYMDELLEAIGARNALRATKIPYPRIGLEELIALDPDAIIDLSMGSEETREIARPWDSITILRAVRENRVIALNASLFRAGPRLPEGLAKLGKLLHK